MIKHHKVLNVYLWVIISQHLEWLKKHYHSVWIINTFASVALTLAKMDLYVHPESDKFNTHGDKSPNIFLLWYSACLHSFLPSFHNEDSRDPPEGLRHPPVSILSSPLYQRMLQFNALSSLH